MVADKLSTSFKNKIDTKDFNTRNSICLPIYAVKPDGTDEGYLLHYVTTNKSGYGADNHGNKNLSRQTNFLSTNSHDASSL